MNRPRGQLEDPRERGPHPLFPELTRLPFGATTELEPAITEPDGETECLELRQDDTIRSLVPARVPDAREEDEERVVLVTRGELTTLETAEESRDMITTRKLRKARRRLAPELVPHPIEARLDRGGSRVGTDRWP